MKFRTAILTSSMTLVVGVVVAAVVTVSAAIDRSARRDLDEELARSTAVFRELQGYRASLNEAHIDVVAQEPRLKAVTSTAEIDHATVLDSARELQRSSGADLLLLTDGAGRLRADTADPSAEGFDLSGMPLVAEALENGRASAVWVDDRGAYQVQARALSFGDERIGVIVLGFAIDEQVAATIERQTGAGVAIILGETILAVSSEGSVPGAATAELVGLSTEAEGESRRLEIGGAVYLARAGLFPEARADQELRFVVLRSLDKALADSRAIVRQLLWIAGLALIAAIGLATFVARRLARPLDGLVDFTREIAAGELRGRDRIGGSDEVRALGGAMNRMVRELAESRAQIREKQRLEHEMELAAEIQTSIVPAHPEVPGLEIVTVMRTATEVGGDYYDVIPTADGAWIGIGDVAGHGLRAGLVMLMVQSAVASLTRERPAASPRELVGTLNRVIYDNVRERLGQDEHVTFSLLRYYRGGLLRFAGAHEPFLLVRAATGECEEIETPGTWVGVIPEIADALVDTEIRLEVGDLILLYSDGLVEARSASGEFFGLGRVRERIVAGRDGSLQDLADGLVGAAESFRDQIEDDISFVLFRVGDPSSAEV